MPTDEKVLLTAEGLQKLKDELHFLKTVRKKEIAKRLEEAISYGDLSENAEYDEAKSEQAFCEGRIIELEKMIKNAKIISPAKSKTGKVGLGSKVEIKDLSKKENHKFTIVGATETDPFGGKISNESPVGKSILGKKKGERAEVVAPGGKFEVEVLSVN